MVEKRFCHFLISLIINTGINTPTFPHNNSQDPSLSLSAISKLNPKEYATNQKQGFSTQKYKAKPRQSFLADSFSKLNNMEFRIVKNWRKIVKV